MVQIANRITTLFELDDRGWAKGIKNLRTDVAAADGLVNKLKAGAKGLGDVLRDNAASAATAAAAALFAFGKAAVSSFQDGALAAGEFAAATGTTADQASRLIEVADDIGVSADVMQSAIQRMSKAAADGKIEIEGFGNTVAKTAAGNTDTYQTFINTATAIGAIADAAKREAAARATFGKSWADIARLMQMSAEDLKAALEGVSDGEIFDAEEVARAQAFQAAIKDLQGAVDGLKNSVGSELVGNLTDLANAATAVAAALPTGTIEALTAGFIGGLNPLKNFTDAFGSLKSAITGEELDGITAGIVGMVGPTGQLANETERLADAQAAAAANAIIAAQANADDPAVIRANAAATAEYTQRLLEMANSIDGIPAEKYVEIKAAIAEGDYQRANALLDALAADRVARLTVLVSAQMGGQMGQVGSGVNAAVAAAAAAGRNVGNAYSSAIAAAMGGGGGGGGGGASVAEEEVVTWEEAMARAYAYGEITREQYRQFHAERLAGLDKYTDAYDESMRIIMQLDKDAASERKKADEEAARAAQEAADAAKKLADEQRKAAQDQLAEMQKMAALLTDLLTATYGNLNSFGGGAGSGATEGEIADFVARILRSREEGLS